MFPFLAPPMDDGSKAETEDKPLLPCSPQHHSEAASLISYVSYSITNLQIHNSVSFISHTLNVDILIYTKFYYNVHF